MKKVKQLLYAWIDKQFLNGCSSFNSLETRKNCRSKKQARQAFALHGIPHAEGMVFYGPISPIRFVRSYGFPVVIKPNVGGFSRGSHFPINSYSELVKALFLVKLWWPSSVIEQYLEGKNYRIVVIEDEVMSLIQRYPPFIRGDGVSTIGTLIDRENEIRDAMGLHPVMYPIKKNGRIQRYLNKNKMDFSTIPEKDKLVTLFNRVALAPGGVIETLDKTTIHPDNLEILLKIVPIFDANILGIDAIFEKGIEYSHREQRVIFLEVNSRPYLKMHDYPRFGDKEDLQNYLDTLSSMDISERDIF